MNDIGRGRPTKLEETKKSLNAQTKINADVTISKIRNSKEEETRKYYCTCCGKGYTKQKGNFSVTYSPLFAGNNGYVHICNSCRDVYFNNITDFFTENEEKAMDRICGIFDWYYEDVAIASSRQISADRSRVGAYPSKMCLSQTKDKGTTYLDTIRDRESKAITSIEGFEEAKEEGTFKLKANSVKVWGFGFSPEDYEYLNNQFSDWKSRVVIDGKAREVLVRELCKLELQKNNALLAGKVDLYQKLVDTYQKTLDRANLTPKQEDANDKASEKPMGVMIDMFENEHPIPEPNEEWKDVDGIIRLLTIYFLGHLCKMLGLKNRYSKMYEEEMDKYRVSIPELEETDDEDVFDFLVNNGASLDKILESEPISGESNGE